MSFTAYIFAMFFKKCVCLLLMSSYSFPCSKAKVLYKFVKVDNRSAEDTAKLLHCCLSCTEEDTKLLKFWMKGLSRQFKEQQLKAARAEKA